MAPGIVNGRQQQRALTYVEVLLTVAITSVIVLALMGVVNTATQTGNEVKERNSVTREARFALARMTRIVGHSPRILLPLADNPGTDWSENLREQTDPPSPPQGSSTLATAVLAVTLPSYVDLDGNGVADADNDADGRIDEDLPSDNNLDGAPGIVLIDDDGDGSVDEGGGAKPEEDNDEDGKKNDDWLNLIDDDNDGSVDEDVEDDSNDDGKAGIRGVDDDADGVIDEGGKKDDDEDGSEDEDWYDSVVYFLRAGSSGQLVLIERTPVPWDTNADTVVDGGDYRETEIARGVSHFRVERLQSAAGVTLVDLTLVLTDAGSGESISLQTRVRVGGAL